MPLECHSSALPIELQAHDVTDHLARAVTGTTRHNLRRSASPNGINCAAPGRVRPGRSSLRRAGFTPSPALCDDGLLLPFNAVGTIGFVNSPHSSGGAGGCQGLKTGGGACGPVEMPCVPTGLASVPSDLRKDAGSHCAKPCLSLLLAGLEQVPPQNTVQPARPASLGCALWPRPTVEEESDF